MSVVANTLVIVAFGTSLTSRGGWQEPLEAAARHCLAQSVRVVSVAKPGANSSWATDNVDKVVVHKPDVVVIEFAVNDASLLRGVSKAQARANISRIIAELRHYRSDIEIVLMATNPVGGWRGWVRPNLNGYYDQLADISAETNTIFVDLRPMWRQFGEGAIADGLHPDPAASGVVVAPALADKICASRSASLTFSGGLQ